MNKSMLTGILVGAALATAGGAIAGYTAFADRTPTEAEVLDVAEITQTQRTPREVCNDVAVTRQKPVQDENRLLGTIAGAVVGGALGNQVGGGNGKKIATVAGAAAGGYAGNRIQENMQNNSTYTTTERRCQTVYDSHNEVVGYNVQYRIGDQTGTVRMDHKPGDTIPLKDGELVLSSN